MKIGIIYDDINRPGLNCQRPDKGNPGIGGTQYCFLMLIYYLRKNWPDLPITVYHHRNVEYIAPMPHEESIEYVTCKSLEEIIANSANNHVTSLVFAHPHVMEISPLLEKYRVNGIVWIHNWIRGEILNAITDTNMIKRAVFLGGEHYDRYMDHKVMKKAVTIPNMFCADDYVVRNQSLGNIVTYTGAIVPGKGFAALAKSWKKVIELVPDAELYVLGNGNLYKEDQVMGRLGIAEKEYEDSFFEDVTDENGDVLPSIHFMGILGAEKNEIYKKTKVGVVNPTGVTEVCPISALEMEAVGVPVVSRFTNGLPDVVISKKTGILIKKSNELTKAIVELLRNDALNVDLGTNAKAFVRERFNPTKIVQMWYEVFQGVEDGRSIKENLPSGNYTNNYKWIRVVSKKIKKVISAFPSIIDIEETISNRIRGK